MSKVDVDVFSFEDLPGEHGLFDFLGCLNNGVYYETPVSWFDVVRLLDQGVHHASAIQAKINILKVTFEPMSRPGIYRGRNLKSWRLIIWCWATAT